MSIVPPTPEPHYADSTITLHHQPTDGFSVLASLPDASVDAVVADPPYGLEFMGKGWDAPWRAQTADVNADAGFNGGGIDQTRNLPSFTGSTNPKCLRCKGTRRGRRDGTAKVAVCMCEDGGHFPNVRAVEMRAFAEWCETWTTECLRVLKPGGHLLAFGGTRTWHRLTCAVEDAGFEIRDSIAWLYGSGFPKSLNLVDDDGERTGWGTALKPAFEPIVVARKPLAGTVAANVLAHGTGALNIDACRVGDGSESQGARPAHEATASNRYADAGAVNLAATPGPRGGSPAGRWPANVVLDESQAEALDEQTGTLTSGKMLAGTKPKGERETYGRDAAAGYETQRDTPGDQGGASRFLYVAKAGADERVRVDGIAHPTVKPLALMRWLVRLVTPPGGTVLEPFAGSGTTVESCILEGFQCIAIEREADYLPLIRQRIHRRRDPVAAVKGAGEDGGLFDLLGEEPA